MVQSKVREYQWVNLAKNSGGYSTTELTKLATRAENENKLKKNASFGTSQYDQYLRRATMSDNELKRRVKRVEAKNKIKSSAEQMTKKDKELGAQIVQRCCRKLIPTKIKMRAREKLRHKKHGIKSL